MTSGERAELPDTVVSDYDMPERNGLELLPIVREVHGAVPFVLFPGTAREDLPEGTEWSSRTAYRRNSVGPERFVLLADWLVCPRVVASVTAVAPDPGRGRPGSLTRSA